MVTVTSGSVDIELGTTLRQLRDFAGKSLKAVAEPSKISSAYLQKLERGEVASPSPNILYRLAQTLGADYLELMRRAGYVVPGESESGSTHALSSKDLTDEEAEALITYLQIMRERERRGHA